MPHGKDASRNTLTWKKGLTLVIRYLSEFKYTQLTVYFKHIKTFSQITFATM